MVLCRYYRSGIMPAMSLRSEIGEQSRVVRRLLDEGWPEARVLGRALARVEHITIAARGSSDNAATYGKYLFESVAGVTVRQPPPAADGTSTTAARANASASSRTRRKLATASALPSPVRPPTL